MLELMDTRTLVLAGLLVGCALALMALAHETHYRRRTGQLERGRMLGWADGVNRRLDALEAVVAGDHTL